MNNNQLKNELLSLFNDEDIKNSIIDIVLPLLNKEQVASANLLPNEIELLNQHINTIRQELIDKELVITVCEKELISQANELDARKSKIDFYESEINFLQQKMLQQQSHFEEEKEQWLAYKNKYAQLDGMSSFFEKLSTKCKDDLKNIFLHHDLISIIVCGVQYANLESLWEYIKIGIIDMTLTEEEQKNLIQFFDVLFSLFNRTTKHPYQLQHVNVGDHFDAQIHTRTTDSKVSGVIDAIYLYGYSRMDSDKPTKKTVVHIS